MRYLYDPDRKLRLKTVELIVEEVPWQPGGKTAARPHDTDRVAIEVGYRETGLRDQVKAAGGIRRPRQKLWEISYGAVRKLGLQGRIVWPKNI